MQIKQHFPTGIVLPPYDAEALIVYQGKLYVFTKNWEDSTSRAYEIPTIPGNYEVTSVSEKTLSVMVTGADIDDTGSSVSLVGYTDPYAGAFKSMIVKLNCFPGNDFFSGSIDEHEINDSSTVGQVEAILFNTLSEFYLSSEGRTLLGTVPPKLYRTEITELLPCQPAVNLSSIYYLLL